jgi:hypothetical protein
MLPVTIALGTVPTLKVGETAVCTCTNNLGVSEMDVLAGANFHDVDRFGLEFMNGNDGARGATMRTQHDFHRSRGSVVDSQASREQWSNQ